LDTSELVATTGYSYDLANRLTALTHQDNTPATFAGYDYTYDAASRITSIDSHLDGLSEYTYDNAGQLTDADHATQTDEEYAYDDNGNRIGGDYDTDPNNLTIEDDDYTYAYDDEGNRVLRTDKTTGDYVEYTWDHRNRLTLVTFKNSSNTTTKQVAYEYDAFDRRVRKRVDTDGNSSWDRGEQYVYDGAHIALQFDDAGDLTRRNLFGPAIDQILASEFIGSPNDTHWYFADHLGTVRDVYSYDDTLHEIVSEGHIVYDSFGNIVGGAAVAKEAHFAYTGREWDADAELFYYRHRWYDAKLGQFVSQDPIGFAAGDANIKRFVGNVVTSNIDPFGRKSFSFSELEKQLQGIAISDEAKQEASQIATAIRNTWSGNFKLTYNMVWDQLTILNWVARELLGQPDERAKGYFCWAWAEAFYKASESRPSKKYFTVIIEHSVDSTDGEGRMHYWVTITSTETGKKVYVDDGFWNHLFVHDAMPSGGNYQYSPGTAVDLLPTTPKPTPWIFPPQ
jgi:RHS repeat-associated protein